MVGFTVRSDFAVRVLSLLLPKKKKEKTKTKKRRHIRHHVVIENVLRSGLGFLFLPEMNQENVFSSFSVHLILECPPCLGLKKKGGVSNRFLLIFFSCTRHQARFLEAYPIVTTDYGGPW